MKKVKKCALGLVAIAASLAALSACDRVTQSDDGVIMTFTDATGARTSYTAQDLLKNYQESGSSLSSQFDKIFEVLVRHYYENYEKNHVDDRGAKMRNLRSTANSDVLTIRLTAQNNANSNGTSYDEELEKLFDSEGVENIDELFEKKLYEAEKKDFNSQMTQNFGTGDNSINGYEAMRDGYYMQGGTRKESFAESADWGIGNEGWLKGQMPYHIRHILVKLTSAADKSYTQDKIGDSTAVGEYGEATKVANVLLELAGAQIGNSGVLEAVPEGSRHDFGSIALNYSDDSSNTVYGEYGIMNKNVVGSDSALVHEFQLGTYAFESLYSKRESSKTDAYRLMPGLKQDADQNPSSPTDEAIDTNQTITINGGEENVYDFFKEEGVGQIPFGAAMALKDTAKTTTDDTNTPVWSDSAETFYPRNVIYNKYFNKHNVCVITPNAIPTNATVKAGQDKKAPEAESEYRYTWLDSNTKAASKAALDGLLGLYTTDSTGAGYVNNTGSITEDLLSKGVYTSQFGNLPGFSVNTTNVVEGINDTETDANAHNVLTDTEGNIVLAVRAGSGSSYQGIHFITVARSALNEYGYKYDAATSQYVNYTEEEVKETNGKYKVNSASLSDYYTDYVPSQSKTDSTSKYPTYGSNNDDVTTYVNYNKNSISEFSDRRGKIETAITSYLSDLNTYEFQRLFENGSITFTDSKLESDVKNYSVTKRQSTQDDLWNTWKNNWKEYAEQIAAQEEARDYGAGTIKGTLLTELCALGYGNANNASSAYSSLFNVGGACYYVKK